MKHICWLLLLTFIVAGCSSQKGHHRDYVAPAVEGRVVDATTGEPLLKARVQRYLGKPTRPDPFTEKGAQHLMTVPIVNTDEHGQFTVAPERSGYLLFAPPPVFELTLVIRHGGYQTLTTNIDLVRIKPVKTNDVVTLILGDVPLEPDAE